VKRCLEKSAVTVSWSQRPFDSGSLSACQQLALFCPNTLLVNVTDREGDLYELFVQALSMEAPAKVHLLVRSRHDRKLEDHSRTLWQEVARQPVTATLKVRVGRRGDQPSRLASLSVRFCAVQLRAPARKAGQPSIQLWARPHCGAAWNNSTP
jgi:hypothetical protein